MLSVIAIKDYYTVIRTALTGLRSSTKTGEFVKKITTVLTVALAAALIGTLACNKAGNQNAQANQANANSNANSNTAAVNSASNTSAATAAAPGSPTEAYKAAYKARQDKDVAALKAMFSKDILEFFGEMAKEEKKTIDDEIKALTERPQAPTAEARNEKINGDKASIEYLDETGKWQQMDFVKEDGKWKLTIPKDEDDANATAPKSNK
jgi:hypothetical protein